MNIRQEGKIANSLRLVAGNRDGKTKRISRLPAFLAILNQYERLPCGKSRLLRR